MTANPLDWLKWSTEVDIVDVADSPFLTCAGKCFYTTERVARDVIAKRCKEIGFKLYPYRCPRCGHIHLTKHPTEVYRLRSQDSAACARSATAMTAPQAIAVSSGHSIMQAAMAAAGIASQLTEEAPTPRERAIRAVRS